MSECEKKNEERIVCLQQMLLSGKEEEVLNELKNTHIENWLGFSEMFPKFAHCATAMGYESVIKYLLEIFPKRIETKNVIGSTLLFTALETRNDPIAQLLIERGANITCTNGRCNSLLHVLAKRSGTFVLSLIQQIIDIQPSLIDHVNCCGETALHLACLCGMIENVQILLKNGANTELETVAGKTARLYLVEAHNSREIEDLLNQYESRKPQINETIIKKPSKSEKLIKENLDESDSEEDFEQDISSIIEERKSQIEQPGSIEDEEEIKEEIKNEEKKKVTYYRTPKIIKDVFNRTVGSHEYKERKLESLIKQLSELYPIDTILTDAPLVYSPNQKYRILSLDGYSESPLVQLYLLQRLVKKYPMFIAKCNMIASVGTSSIIAAPITNGLSLEFLEKVIPLLQKYTELSKKHRFNTSKYTNHYFNVAFNSLFENKLMKDFPRKYFTYYQQLPNNFCFAHPNEKVIDVLMKSCSIPFLFKPYLNCISGVIIQPNPSSYALMEIMKEGIEPNNCVMLSLSSGIHYSPNEESFISSILSDNVSVKNHQLVEGQIEQASLFCSTVLNDSFFRFDPPIQSISEKMDPTELNIKKIVQKVDITGLEQWLRREWLN